MITWWWVQWFDLVFGGLVMVKFGMVVEKRRDEKFVYLVEKKNKKIENITTMTLLHSF